MKNLYTISEKRKGPEAVLNGKIVYLLKTEDNRLAVVDSFTNRVIWITTQIVSTMKSDGTDGGRCVIKTISGNRYHFVGIDSLLPSR